MTRKPSAFLFVVLTLGVTLLAAGCGSSGSDSSSAGGNGTTTSAGASGASGASKAKFCADNDTMNTKSEKATSIAEAIAIFKANVKTIDEFGQAAPDDIKADAQTIVAAAHKVIDTGSTAAFSDPATAAAGKRVDAYCNPAAATTTTT